MEEKQGKKKMRKRRKIALIKAYLQKSLTKKILI